MADVSNEEIMTQMKQQMALANAQGQLSRMTGKCFKACIAQPGTSLCASEQRCISQCVDRFMDVWNLVARTYGNRLQREDEQKKPYDNSGMF
ncbi:mitochondrial import inner membrane translocase subunit Tim13 [Drosophila tropicalis]|uniref:mitochondrial import inner membrane translocase subunit Tim13 n=1 Tax=Drosophila tropicalis TaxID=46794 RepID=UPI0035ABC0A7